MEIVLAADLGGTNLRVAAVDFTGNLIHQIKSETPSNEPIDKIINFIGEMATESRLVAERFGKVSAFTIAVPGTVEPKTEIISNAPNIPSLKNQCISEKLSKRLNLPVITENDANAATVGENWLGASRGFRNSICITLGTGVGGGIMIDGKVLRGVDGTAAEIGHICVEPNGALCGCGSFGCVEQYSSAQAVIRITKELESQFPKSVLRNQMNLTSLEIYKAGKEKDALALEAFRQQGYYLGIALAGLINVLNPEVIVIGGGAAAGSDLFMPSLKDEITKRAYRRPAERAKITLAECGDNAGILGAAKLAFDTMVLSD